ncbi:CDP-diacylglycerol--glycerol-3-phosphate 3-phosphatidyltransferase [Mycoplasma sp. CSL7475-4]|uniref:CDP-diacylglycerol--glycerol-3-phosphate 3-phosphatidyltransferase n=1 Tax=Mycoplasma sp. CSL7475-4 TaxID=2973942 RepID=UPI00216B4FF7|nr:CDP-diacylglycerol--glycerol-3-phosphate 3-phosphatidyltransferase [Mycoplasma sp. CSL7475-4]MCS4537054.1 CDP-diacylglycerol--glycerol-3-phosphate 3-phosphatidyltransferase [Mycoplasma sp. CSL7475-4]
MKKNKSFDKKLPNKLTLLRMFLIIPLLICMGIYIETASVFGAFLIRNDFWRVVTQRILISLILAIFVVGMITDFFDGHLARKYNVVSAFGKLWDPIADKVMTTSVLVFLTIASQNFIPFVIVILFVIRDLIVDGVRAAMKGYGIDVAASKWGKIKTIILTISIVISLLLMTIWPNFSFSKHQNIVQVIRLVVNIPLIIALVFSIFSGILYVSKLTRYMKKNNK